MSADRLREAARVLRDRAEAATDGTTWHAERTDNCVTVFTSADEAVFEDAHANLNDARYIATMQPDVGLALADILDGLATNLPDWEPGRRAADLILGGAA